MQLNLALGWLWAYLWGNVSALDRKNAVAHKTKWVAYSDLNLKDMVIVDLWQYYYCRVKMRAIPQSTKTQFPIFIKTGKLLGRHSPYAMQYSVAWAQAQKDIPIFRAAVLLSCRILNSWTFLVLHPWERWLIKGNYEHPIRRSNLGVFLIIDKTIRIRK